MTARRLPLLLASALLAIGHSTPAQRPSEQLDAAEILHRMQKLAVVGSVLYLAAHPDDENTRLISALSNGRKVRTAYLSLTRGDGGQNLIGAELGDALGILRTEELREARRIDGGEQFFTRAVDFGYSKSPAETLAKWGHDAILADVVRVVRTFRPDVIVTRFATDGSGGHGQHTASALLAREAFERAGDAQAFPEQLAEGLAPWTPGRLFFNASTWWSPDLPAEAAREPARWAVLDVGGFDALLGVSYTELAGRSRSQHKSQGFGAAEPRGEALEYLRLEAGASLASADPFDGVELGWRRIPEGQRIAAQVEALLAGYDPLRPERSLTALAELLRALEARAAGDEPGRSWARHHAAAVRELILQVCGLVLEATSESAQVAQGTPLTVEFRALQRRPGPALELVGFTGPGGVGVTVGERLVTNRTLSVEHTFTPDAALGIDQPYWLAAPHGNLYRPAGDAPGIAPAAPTVCTFRGTLRLPDGSELSVERPLMHTWVDRVAGQRTRAVTITPVASIAPADPVVLVRGEEARVAFELEALVDGLAGTLAAEPPAGWHVEAGPAPLAALARGERRRCEFVLRREPGAAAGALRVTFAGPRGTSAYTLHVLAAEHVQPQTWYTAAEVRLVPLEVALDVHTVGFVEGAGDEMPRALARLGLAVERLDPATARAEDLERCDAIVTGIRAYDTVPALARFQPELLAYVERGGTLLVQYNTVSASGNDPVLDPRRIGPRPFTLTRGRVTVEDAPARLLAPEHPLLSTPNRIGAADFAGWVQERGLYFAGELDPLYTPLIAWNDPGEEPLLGGLITCEHGRGRFTYTGLSLFRQLPAGVPGAYRLLANLLARRAPREPRPGAGAENRR